MTYLWIFYRFKEDGMVTLGLQHPWDAHGHGHHDDHEHEHTEIEWVKEKPGVPPKHRED